VAGPVVAGPVVAGPVVAGPVVAGPVVAGPVVAGPVVAGPVVAGIEPGEVFAGCTALLVATPLDPHPVTAAAASRAAAHATGRLGTCLIGVLPRSGR